MVEAAASIYLGRERILLESLDKSSVSGAFASNGAPEVVDASAADGELGEIALRALAMSSVTSEEPDRDAILAAEHRRLKAAAVSSRTRLAEGYEHVALQVSDGRLLAYPSFVDKPRQGYGYSRSLEPVVVSDPSPGAVGSAIRLAAERCVRGRTPRFVARR